jgi:hypothetical protein
MKRTPQQRLRQRPQVLIRPTSHNTSFACQPATPPPTPVSQLLQERARVSPSIPPARYHRVAARKNADTSAGKSAAMTASSGIQQARPAADKRPFSETTVSPPSLAQANPLQREFSPLFIRHAHLPCSSVIFILTAINICYSSTWLSLRASTFPQFNVGDHTVSSILNHIIPWNKDLLSKLKAVQLLR